MCGAVVSSTGRPGEEQSSVLELPPRAACRAPTFTQALVSTEGAECYPNRPTGSIEVRCEARTRLPTPNPSFQTASILSWSVVPIPHPVPPALVPVVRPHLRGSSVQLRSPRDQSLSAPAQQGAPPWPCRRMPHPAARTTAPPHASCASQRTDPGQPHPYSHWGQG